MKNVLRILIAAAFSAVVFTALPHADAGGPAPFVPGHRHYLNNADGSKIQFGPRVCDDPSLQTAFNNFHARIHVGTVRDALAHDHNLNSISAGPC